MAWDFSTDPGLAEELRWMREFLDTEILPLETLNDVWRAPGGYARYAAVTAPLKAEVKRRGLWAAHLPVELGGGGFGQVRLALMHEILGRSDIAPAIFGNNAPNAGNAELLSAGGTDEQKDRWLVPLLAGDIQSSFAMTEPVAGSDPTMLQTRAVRDGDEWVLNGHKWFATNASNADVLFVVARTGEDNVDAHRAYSIVAVPRETLGMRVVREIPTLDHLDPRPGQPGAHCEVLFTDARVPFENVIGGEAGVGEGFALAQKRLGPGRVHHAMRWLGQAHRAFDLMCERAVSRSVKGAPLARRQLVQDMVAESYAEIQAARLVTLQAAWTMDQLEKAGRHMSEARVEIGVIKFWGARVLMQVIDRAIQVNGSLGYSADLPLEFMWRRGRASRFVNGPDEVHKENVARAVLRRYHAVEVPTEHVPTRREAALARYAELLDAEAVSL